MKLLFLIDPYDAMKYVISYIRCSQKGQIIHMLDLIYLAKKNKNSSGIGVWVWLNFEYIEIWKASIVSYTILLQLNLVGLASSKVL